MKKELRIQVWSKYNQKCAYCGCELEYKAIQVDHIEPLRRPVAYRPEHRKDPFFKKDMERVRAQMKAAENLKSLNPACRSCNIDKHALSIENWRKVLENKVVCLRRISNFRIMERYGVVSVLDVPIVFYFEKFEKEEGKL